MQATHRPTFHEYAVSAVLTIGVPVGVAYLWVKDRWDGFKALLKA